MASRKTPEENLVGAVRFLLTAGLSTSTDERMCRAIPASAKTLARHFGRTGQQSLRTSARDLALRKAWGILTEMLTQAQDLRGFVEEALMRTDQDDPESTYIAFAFGYGRGRAESFASEELNTFNAALNSAIGARPDVDAIREAIYGALSQVAWMRVLDRRLGRDGRAKYTRRSATRTLQRVVDVALK